MKIMRSAIFLVLLPIMIAVASSVSVSARTEKHVVAPKKNKAPALPATPKTAATLKTQHQELSKRLRQIKKDIAKSEADHSEAADALAQSEQAISDTNRQLRLLAAQQKEIALNLRALQEQQQNATHQLNTQQTQLAALLRQHYINGTSNALQSWLSGENPHQIQRDAQYLSYIAQAQKTLLQRLQATQAQLNSLAQAVSARQVALAEVHAAQETQKRQLVQQTLERRRVLAAISSKIKKQKRTADALARDEKRLINLVKQISRTLAQHKKKYASPTLSKRSTTTTPRLDTTSGNNVIARNDLLPSEDLPDDAFAKLKGRLHLPVRGDITNKFGSARNGGGPSWKGLFIRAQDGSEIHAIAAGRVVFAEWLRGFGNLLILDHGGQYLSIYGNNEALFKAVGDTVKPADVIASVGNSGGQSETGLYFELRHAGQPFDPLRWVSLQ